MAALITGVKSCSSILLPVTHSACVANFSTWPTLARFKRVLHECLLEQLLVAARRILSSAVAPNSQKFQITSIVSLYCARGCGAIIWLRISSPSIGIAQRLSMPVMHTFFVCFVLGRRGVKLNFWRIFNRNPVSHIGFAKDPHRNFTRNSA